MVHRLFAPIILVTVSLLAIPGDGGAQDSVAREIEQRVELLRDAGKLVIAGATVRNGRVLGDVYEAAAFASVWTDAAAAKQLLDALRATSADGLDPADYNVAAIDSLAKTAPGAATIAELDLLRTDALLRVTHDLRFGRVAPTAGEASVTRGATNAGELDADQALRLIRSGRLRAARFDCGRAGRM
jgi:hypothetical protein